MHSYRPSGKIEEKQAFSLFFSTTVINLFLATAFFLVGTILYIPLLFPFLMGYIWGSSLEVLLERCRCRSLFLALFLALLGSFVAYGVSHYEGYLLYHRQVVKAKRIPSYELNQGQREAINKARVPRDMWDYLKMEATRIHTLQRPGQVYIRSALKSPYPGLVVFFLEFLLILVPSALRGLGRVYHPYCEECGEWYTTQATIPLLERHFPQITRAFRSRDLGKLPAYPSPFPREKGGYIEWQACPKCRESPPHLQLVEFVSKSQGGSYKKRVGGSFVTSSEAVIIQLWAEN